MNELNVIKRPSYSLRRIFSKTCLVLARLSLTIPSLRILLIRLAGVRINGHAFIGADVEFDGLNPELIQIGHDCVITSGVKILSHFYNTSDRLFYSGKVTIGNYVFLGMNSLIVNPVNIGNNVIVGAGSVITRDIPDNQLWAGNPAVFIRDLDPIEIILIRQQEALK